MEEIFSLPPIKDFFNNDYALVLEFMETLGNPKFKIAGDVDLVDSYIESLGNLVEVEKNLDLFNTKKIASLPDNLKVGGYLDLRYTDIESLPDNLKVSRSLFLSNSKIESLPDNLHVGEDLDLGNTYIESLPDNLHVGGVLDLENTPLSDIYSKEEIRKIIKDKGGYVKSRIYV